MRSLIFFLATALLVQADDFEESWAVAAALTERGPQVARLMDRAVDPKLPTEERIGRLWRIYLIAQTADEHRAILREAAKIKDPAARMLVGVYRFNEYHETLGREQSAANKAQLTLLHDGRETLNYKDLPDNGYDTPFAFDRWEDPDGIAGRWIADGITLDISPRPSGTFHGRLTHTGHPPVILAGALRQEGAILIAPGVEVALTRLGGEIHWKGQRVSLQRQAVGKTPGMEKPAGAVTLYDGTNVDAFQPTTWEPVSEKALRITRGSRGLMTKEKFGDMRLHLEFRQAYNAETVGARRGNSGVILMNMYEIALSDNFADPPQIKANGAIYGVAAPLVNASAAPLEWQSLVIDFTAPRFNDAGKRLTPAKVTAWQNGRLLHDGVEITVPWEKKKREPREPAPLQLQQHGSSLEFRNIWVMQKP